MEMGGESPSASASATGAGARSCAITAAGCSAMAAAAALAAVVAVRGRLGDQPQDGDAGQRGGDIFAVGRGGGGYGRQGEAKRSGGGQGKVCETGHVFYPQKVDDAVSGTGPAG